VDTLERHFRRPDREIADLDELHEPSTRLRDQPVSSTATPAR
jgi:hypothetical protein